MSALLLCACASVAQLRQSSRNEQVQTVVREFCRQDFLGARLSPTGWDRVKQLTTWKDNPVWKSFRVITRYEQTTINAGFHSARVGVKYMVMGRFDLGTSYTPMNESQDVEFRVKEIDGDWRIDETDPDVLEPEVSKQAALQWLQAKQKSSTDPAEKISIETALKALAPQK